MSLLSKRIQVYILIDTNESDRNFNRQIEYLRESGAVVRVANPEEPEIQTKFCIIDGTKVMNGSMNWGDKELKSLFDNLLFIQNAGIIGKYIKEFNYHWENGIQFSASGNNMDRETRHDDARHGRQDHQQEARAQRDRSRSRERPSASKILP